VPIGATRELKSRPRLTVRSGELNLVPRMSPLAVRLLFSGIAKKSNNLANFLQIFGNVPGDEFAEDSAIRHAVSDMAHSPGVAAKNARVGAMRPPHRHRRELTCRVTAASRRFSLCGPVIRCRCPGRTHCMVEICGHRERCEVCHSRLVSNGRNYHQYQETQRPNDTSVPGY
jgi:hypothetical protein